MIRSKVIVGMRGCIRSGLFNWPSSVVNKHGLSIQKKNSLYSAQSSELNHRLQMLTIMQRQNLHLSFYLAIAQCNWPLQTSSLVKYISSVLPHQMQVLSLKKGLFRDKLLVEILSKLILILVIGRCSCYQLIDVCCDV